MHRDVLDNLRAWKADASRMPLILRGARQVGKSWLARELGKEFPGFVEINFDREPELSSLFEHSVVPEKLLSLISNYVGKPIIPGKTLLFLDEIQNCPRALAALRYLFEEMPALHVLGAGSLLEFELCRLPVPVGRVSFLHVHPLSFGEYLCALGKQSLRAMLIENELQPLPAALHLMLSDHVRDYTLVGGMPQVVQDFIEHRDLSRSRGLQSSLIQTYQQDFNKYAKVHQIKYLKKVFDAIPFQVGNKFKYVSVSREHRSRELSEALELLCMAGIADKVHHSSGNGTPLRAQIDLKRFKVTFFDVGLILRMLKIDHRPVLLEPNIGSLRDGAIAELFVAQQIRAHADPREEFRLHYWHREARASNAEIDFLIELDGKVLPVEVKSGSVGRMKSLGLFLKEKAAPLGIKISAHPFSRHDKVLSVPFYGVEALLESGPIIFKGKHSP